MKKRIAILGSTGSIGTQALQVIKEHPDIFEAQVLTAKENVELLIQQARSFMPDVVVIANKEKYDYLSDALKDLPIKVYAGSDAIEQVVQMDTVDMVLTAMVGFSGFKPTIAALLSHKTIALANKETLVVAGEYIKRIAQEHNGVIIPVDSEHSAIFQSIQGEHASIDKILLTASGGPFLHYSLAELERVTPAQALRHPRWEMGAKITIDSATMMNKGFEVIEAKWLFGVHEDQIEVLVHPQSIVHSAVQFRDGAIKAQLGVPDMRLPIQYAFSYPNRLSLSGDRLDLFAIGNLSFYRPDIKKFRCLELAYEAMSRGGNIPCVMNAANEIANKAFRESRISFLKIPDLIETAMNNTPYVETPVLEDYLETDKYVREKTTDLIKQTSY